MLSLLFCLLIGMSEASAAPTITSFPESLNSFLGEAPALYTQKLLPQAKELKKSASDLSRLKKAASGEYGDYANYLLGQIYASKGDHKKSLDAFQTILRDFPRSALLEEIKPLEIQETLALGVQKSKAKKSEKKEAQRLLIRGLELLSWKDWEEHEDAVDALLDILEDSDAELYNAYLSEALLALPVSSPLRMGIVEDLSADELREFTQTAKYRGVPTPPGIKPVNPDSDLFDEAITSIMQEKWDLALATFEKIETLYPQSDQLDRVHYWHARALQKLGKNDEALKLFSALWDSNPLNYYGLLSAQTLGKDLMSLAKSNPEEDIDLELEGSLLPRQLAGLWKIKAFLEVGFLDFARLEAEALFNYRPNGAMFGQTNPRAALALANLFATAGFRPASFSQAWAAVGLDANLYSETSLNFLFPRAFWQELNAASELTGINSFLLLSLTKQESAFDPRALSHSDAYGLMQLLPGTAREIGAVAKRRDLFQPELNTTLGAQYLRKLLDRFNGNIALALAAYNAGPSRAAQWQKNLASHPLFQKQFPVELFIETIPFMETRKYVSSILRNYTWYKVLNKDATITPIQELAFQWQKKPSNNPNHDQAQQAPNP